MAQKVEVHLEDDLDGGPAEETISFALDGRDYEIDLSDANAERLREALRPFGRRPEGRPRRRPPAHPHLHQRRSIPKDPSPASGAGMFL